jgi:hypothetical protein
MIVYLDNHRLVSPVPCIAEAKRPYLVQTLLSVSFSNTCANECLSSVTSWNLCWKAPHRQATRDESPGNCTSKLWKKSS